MEYKALMLDVDGTLIPYEYFSSPSQKIIQAIKKAKEKVTVCLVTGRAFNATEYILKAFDIHSGYIVTNGGAVVLDIETKKPIYDRPIDKSDAQEIVSILGNAHIEFYVKDNVYEGMHGMPPFNPSQPISQAYMMYAYEFYSHEEITTVFNKLSKFPNLTLHKTRHKDPQKYGLNITHAEATKLHGINMVLEKISVSREEVIGVGDGYNDFPLLMASGLKVAMGNAISDLKEIADYIAPSVNDDGVADVIQKFILKD